MGIPSFFRWLSKKYSGIIVNCNEEKPNIAHGKNIPVDTSQPNPNECEFDNFYVDMNAIIHICCHLGNKPAPKNEEEIMIAVFQYIDRIFGIIRPRRLLYIAIDGVAPKAKMNQQRSRRFRDSKETRDKSILKAKLLSQLNKRIILPEETKEDLDRNCITPGTKFMDRLSKCLNYYILDRLNNDPGWKNIVVILSDANVPGEGEHKIMDFIRRQKFNKEHDANTRHCVYGSDADLIVLGLASHERDFTIIREKLTLPQPFPWEICGQIGHKMQNCTAKCKEKEGELHEGIKIEKTDVKFIFIKLHNLRECLAVELAMENLPFPFDLQRVIDDWIFMCFLIGNDFLPHLPSLGSSEKALDSLIELYRNAVCKVDGYITNNGYVELSRLQIVMTELAEKEYESFKRQQELADLQQNREKERKKKMKAGCSREVSSVELGAKRKKEESDSDESEPERDVLVPESDWKEIYYETKFHVSRNDIEFRQKLAAEYVVGLCWMLKYYYQGCASWKWYFPYHYAPFASDLINIADIKIDFDLGKPLKPFEQMMAIFPAASKQLVPESWGELMSNSVSPMHSPIADLYPSDFKIDKNGKKHAWQGVVLLPFVDEKRLLDILESVYPKLTDEEIRRNLESKDKLYIGKEQKGYKFVVELYEDGSKWKQEIKLKTEFFCSLNGTIQLSEDVVYPEDVVKSPVQGLPDLRGNAALWVIYNNPQYPEEFIFPSERLKAVDPPVFEPDQVCSKAQTQNSFMLLRRLSCCKIHKGNMKRK